MKKLEAIVTYLAFEGSLELLDDVDSLHIFLSSHDFDACTVGQLQKEIGSVKLQKSRAVEAKKLLSKSEKKQLDDYLLLCNEVEIPTFSDDEFDNSPLVSSDDLKPYAHLKHELDDLNHERTRLHEKEERLMVIEDSLEAKERLLTSQANSLRDSSIHSAITRIDERIKHFTKLVQQHNAVREAQQERMHAYVERESQLRLAIAEYSRIQSQLQSSIILKQNELTEMEKKKIQASFEAQEKNQELLKLNKQIHKITRKYSEELEQMELTRKELAAKEEELELSFGRVDSFKEELLEKQVNLEEKEAELIQDKERYREELDKEYAKRVSKLERDYEERQKELFRKVRRVKVQKMMQPQVQDVHDIRMLVDIARNEATFNTHLAKNTYERIVKLYEELAKQQQQKLHGKIVDLHNFIKSKEQ